MYCRCWEEGGAYPLAELTTDFTAETLEGRPVLRHNLFGGGVRSACPMDDAWEAALADADARLTTQLRDLFPSSDDGHPWPAPGAATPDFGARRTQRILARGDPCLLQEERGARERRAGSPERGAKRRRGA